MMLYKNRFFDSSQVKFRETGTSLYIFYAVYSKIRVELIEEIFMGFGIAAALSIFVLLYLIYVIFNPEKF